MILQNRKKSLQDSQNDWLKIYRYYAIYYPFYRMEPHAHAEWEIMYVTRGRCRIHCGKQEREIYELKEGEYLVLGGWVEHKLVVEPQNPCRILNLEGRMEPADGVWKIGLLQDTFLINFWEYSGPVLKGNDDGRLYEVLRSLILTMKETSTGEEAGVMEALLCGEFLSLLAKQYDTMRRNHWDGSRYINEAIRYLEENYDRELRIQEAARAVGISEGYLQRLFRQEKGMTMLEMVNDMRIEKAKLLLESSTLPVVDIAINVGFNSRQHFSAVFLRRTGCSPAVWRKNKGVVQAASGHGDLLSGGDDETKKGG